MDHEETPLQRQGDDLRQETLRAMVPSLPSPLFYFSIEGKI